MPWNKKQHRLFEAAAHDSSVAKRVGIPKKTAKKLASEGVEHESMGKRGSKPVSKRK